MNKIDTYCFSKTGKYKYGKCEVEVPEEMNPWDDSFIEFVRNNCEISYKDTFNYTITIIDHIDNTKFFTRMIKD